MSYSLRNTLVLLLTLCLMAAGGWAFLKYNYDDAIALQQGEIVEKQQTMVLLNQKAADYERIENELRRIRFEYDNHSKQFFSSSSVSIMFDYLRSINFGQAETTMNFTLIDSTLQPKYGITRVKLEGQGTYSGFYNFITTLEQSKPLSKITDIKIGAQNELANRNMVSYEATIQFYYTRGTVIEYSELLFTPVMAENLNNPFSPLVRQETRGPARPPEEPATTAVNLPPNTENLPVVDKSKLMALVRSGAYLEDHNGEMVYLPVGGRVYLGVLNEISLAQKTATFRINRGTRTEDVTLRISENQ